VRSEKCEYMLQCAVLLYDATVQGSGIDPYKHTINRIFASGSQKQTTEYIQAAAETLTIMELGINRGK
jgi:hypothetical protein